MSEKPPTGPSPEELRRRREEKEQMEQYEQWMIDHPEAEIIKRDIDEEHSPEIAEFEELLVLFEIDHFLPELHAITEEEDARTSPLRERASKALGPILTILNTLERETNISPEKFKELDEKYRRLSRAVGIVNSGKVDHTM